MRGLGTSIVVLLAACDAPSAEVTVLAHKQPTADLDLKKATVALTQTSTTAWTLDKVGSKGAATITWQATATEGATQAGLLIVNGTFKLKNRGKGGATIGNIVVNLQTKVNGHWVTRASDIADATDDDAATAAYVDSDRCSEHKQLFQESSASGHLLFTDDATNSAFALVPQVTIAPNATQKLRFSASFDNTVLHLPTGSKARVEIIVSFGNARPGKGSAHDVDINGNGIIDQDEHWVESVDVRKELVVPPEIPSNTQVVLTDSPADITTTGTVTFSNPTIAINGLTALVTVHYDGGTSGGTITNCAHLTGDGQTATVDDDKFPNVQGIDLTACDTQVIGPHTCTPGTVGCGWKPGEVVTHIQDDWGDAGTAAGVLLGDRFNTVYGTQGYVEVGLPGAGGFSMLFTNAGAVFTYQPASGTAAALTADLVDPTSTASGIFGGEVLALRFNIDLADAGYLAGTSGLHLGDLTLCGVAAGIDGTTVRSFIAVANTALGGGATPYSIDQISQLAANVNAAFDNGNPSLFAEAHLFNGACPP